MGAYMSAPNTEKESSDEVHDHIEWGVSGMQGWRTSMEDAHCCLPDIDNKKNSMFGVFDGHGGREVAEYCAKNLHQFLLDCDSYREGDIETALRESFLNIDAAITSEEVINELKSMCDDSEDEEGDEDEAAMLLEEANMPIEQLIERFKGSVKEQLKQNGILESGSEDEDNDDDDDNGVVQNGHAESDEKPEKEAIKSSSKKKSQKSTVEKQISSSSSNSTEETKSENQDTGQSSSSTCEAESSSKTLEVSSTSTSKAGGSSKDCSSTSSSSTKKNKKDIATTENNAGEEEEEDADDDDDDEEDSDEEDDDEEEDEFEDGEGMEFQQGSEEVGKDSGTTAIVAVIHNNKLYVANAGDSRCLLCRSGKALEMSIDHKPEDEDEKARIEKAGGKITSDGRVMGGLNLSRAIGDHTYKQNSDLELKDQMITANPDIRQIEITKDDDYMVLACDGIWNVMTNEEVVDFINERLQSDEKPALSKICEELFDACLAPNTENDGTGCDNMTCMIVRFKHGGNTTTLENTTKGKKSSKRTLNEQSGKDSKRVKLDEMD